MELSAYLKRQGLSDEEFGAKIGRSRVTVSRLRRKVLRPNWQTMLAIKEATAGKVTPQDFTLLEERGEATG